MWHQACLGTGHAYSTNIRNAASTCGTRRSACDFACSNLRSPDSRSDGFEHVVDCRHNRPRTSSVALRGARFVSPIDLFEWARLASNSVDSAICTDRPERRIFQCRSIPIFAVFKARLRSSFLGLYRDQALLADESWQCPETRACDWDGVFEFSHGEIGTVAQTLVVAANSIDRD